MRSTLIPLDIPSDLDVQSTRVGRYKPPPWVGTYAPVVEAVVALLHPHAEVVLHDVEPDRIAAIWNSWSGRVPGDRSLITAEDLPTDGKVLGPYEKVGTDGHRITSVSVLVENGAGLLCVNLDRFPLDEAIDALSRFAAAVEPRPQALFERDWREQIALTVDAWCRDQRLARDRLSRTQRLELVRHLDALGLFATRRAAEHLALTLGISRATVYALIKEARS
jgi:predicted transcriptional regulator YheO